MKISFVIPAYNEEKLLHLCLGSIQKELASTACEAEIIVVNNASTDKTSEIARSFKGVRIVDEPRKGLTRARHAGHMASSGELIANIDADTILPEGWVAKTLREFGNDPSLLALSGPFIYHDLSLGQRVLVKIFYMFGFVSYVLHHYVLRVGALLQGGNFVVRRSSLEQIGGFDRSIEFYGEDIDIARRLNTIGKVKWTFRQPVYASGRRLKHEGIVRTGMRYTLNYFWITFTARPWHDAYSDIRP